MRAHPEAYLKYSGLVAVQETPLFLAAGAGRHQMVHWLLENCDVRVNYKNWVCLQPPLPTHTHAVYARFAEHFAV